MLSKIIVSSFAACIEIALWLTLITFVAGGWSYSNPLTGESGGFLGAIFGLGAWFVIAVVFFGSFLILSEIRKSVQNLENLQNKKVVVKKQISKVQNIKSEISECDIPYERDFDSIKVSQRVDFTDGFAEKMQDKLSGKPKP